MAKVTKTMPVDFRHHFKRCICIIDCFEVFCEIPSDLMARAQTFSNYKHHNTVKFLIAVTPQVSFIFEIGAGCTVCNVAKNTIEKCMLCHFSFYIVCQARREGGCDGCERTPLWYPTKNELLINSSPDCHTFVGAII